jgi:hypothetical protein
MRQRREGAQKGDCGVVCQRGCQRFRPAVCRSRGGSANSTSMNLRHAAALALVGWYLMVAPSRPQRAVFNTHAPLSQWEWRGSFDTAGDCMRGRTERIKRLSKLNLPFGTVDHSGSIADLYRCIETDDPRLKEK